jgi:hypothetical protein
MYYFKTRAYLGGHAAGDAVVEQIRDTVDHPSNQIESAPIGEEKHFAMGKHRTDGIPTLTQ